MVRLRMWLCRGCGKMGVLRRLREWREKRGGTLEGPAIKTGDAFNSDIGDNVDYLDPAWLARTNAAFQRWRPSTQNLSSTSGSGDVTNNFAESVVSTGDTSGSTATISWFGISSDRSRGTPTWDNNITHRCALSFPFGIQDARLYSCVYSNRNGDPTTGDTALAIGVEDEDMVGVTRDGTNTSKVTLISEYSQSQMDGRIEYIAGERAEFYVNGTKEGEITSDLPSGDPGVFRAIGMFAENSVDENRRASTRDLMTVVHP